MCVIVMVSIAMALYINCFYKRVVATDILNLKLKTLAITAHVIPPHLLSAVTRGV